MYQRHVGCDKRLKPVGLQTRDIWSRFDSRGRTYPKRNLNLKRMTIFVGWKEKVCPARYFELILSANLASGNVYSLYLTNSRSIQE
jgi:hypothetical protein